MAILFGSGALMSVANALRKISESEKKSWGATSTGLRLTRNARIPAFSVLFNMGAM
jgi:hypothetical protein